MISTLLVDSSHNPLHFYGRLSKLHASICQSHPLTCSWSPHLQLKGCSEGSKCDLRPWSPTASALSPTESLATIITINLRWASLTTFNKNLNLYTYTLKALFCNLPPTSELPQKFTPSNSAQGKSKFSPWAFQPRQVEEHLEALATLWICHTWVKKSLQNGNSQCQLRNHQLLYPTQRLLLQRHRKQVKGVDKAPKATIQHKITRLHSKLSNEMSNYQCQLRNHQI